jgi:hypothetical protein
MNNILSKLIGANWRTSLWGGITLISVTIATTPSIVAFLPDSIEGYVKGIAGLIAFASGGAFLANVKDKQVTGGIVQQTATGAVASVIAQAQSSSVEDTTKAKPAK